MNSNSDKNENINDNDKEFHMGDTNENDVENLIEIISGKDDYSEEKISLTDVIKFAFDTDDETSNDRVVEDADEEVVFVAPERLLEFVDDYLEHDGEDEVLSGCEKFEPTQTVYFSTDETPVLRIDEGTGEIISADSADDVIGDESEDETKTETKADEFFDTDAENHNEIISETVENSEIDEEQCEIDDDVNSNTAEEEDALCESDESNESDEEYEESTDEFAEDISEPTSDDTTEHTESTENTVYTESIDDNSDTAAAETDELHSALNINDESDTAEDDTYCSDEFNSEDEEEVELYDFAGIPIETDVNSSADEILSGEAEPSDTENELNLEEFGDNEEEMPELFVQNQPVEFVATESTADNSDSGESIQDEHFNEAEDTAEEDSEDFVADTPMLTVHRHRERSEDADYSDDIDESERFEYSETSVKPKKKANRLAEWAKRKTAGGWTKFALKCVGVAVLVIGAAAVLYVNGLLDLIDYKDADDFEQYYNLSDTDYVSSSDEEYENPVHYDSSTTIEGFDESMIDISKDDVVNILLIGTDVRGGTYEDRGNTDSMILLSINTRDKNIKLTSFMRDMYVSIPDRGKNRLNAAYAYGGPQLLFDTLKLNFDVDVDLYARVNFANFRKIVDKVGGIKIELTQAEVNYMNKYSKKYNTKPVEVGLQTLDGYQALSYARCRKVGTDFGRTQRQRKVLIALVDEIKSSSLIELNDLLNELLPMIQTNVPKMQIVGLMVDALSYLNNEIETLNVPIKNSWQSAKIRGMDVICPNFELNKTAIVAHIYSTYKLNVEDTVYKNFDVPQGDSTTQKSTRKTKNRVSTNAKTTVQNTTENSSSETKSTSSTSRSSRTWRTTTKPSITHPSTTTAPAASQTLPSSDVPLTLVS